MYSYGEEGMQLVQPSKFFSVTIFRTCSIGILGTRTCELGMLQFLVMLKICDVCTCPLLRRMYALVYWDISS